MVSDCCGAEDRIIDVGWPNYSEMALCPECGQICNFISEKEYGERYAKEQIENALEVSSGRCYTENGQ